MKKIQFCFAATFSSLFYLNAHAVLFTHDLDFIAEKQSVWGSGGTADFGTSGTLDIGLFDFKYDIGASSGTVESTFSGALSADYDAFLTSTGSTTIDIGFSGDSAGGLLKSDLGAWAKVWVPTAFGDVDIMNYDYGLNINETFTPQIGVNVTGTDSFTAGSAGIDVFVAEAGVDIDIEQTISLEAQALDGKLAYQHRDGGTVYTTDFSLTSGDAIAMDVDLGLEGLWDFWFIDEELINMFETSFDAELVLFEEHFGRTGCLVRVLGECVVPELGTVRNETTLASLDLYSADPFSLIFEEMSDTASFYIEVGGGGDSSVPEPSIIWLLGSGLTLIGFARRKA